MLPKSFLNELSKENFLQYNLRNAGKSTLSTETIEGRFEGKGLSFWKNPAKADPLRRTAFQNVD